MILLENTGVLKAVHFGGYPYYVSYLHVSHSARLCI